MDYRLTNRIVAGLVFLVSLIVFLSTVQPSTSFWDCGEFIAAAVSLQVPHPPGTPGFLIVGRVLSMIPLVENVGLRVNLISVFSSAFSVLFLYLVAVKLIETYRGKPKNLVEGLATIIASATGALAFAFSDTFWFNAVEAEVYAASLFLFAASAYFMMRWNERADVPGSERYLILIFYLLGFSAGVHLMAVLAALPVVMIVYFRKYIEDDEQLKQTAYILLGHVGLLLLIAMVMWAGETDSQPPTQEYFNDFDSKMKIIFAVVSVGVVIAFWKRLVARNSIYIPIVVGSIALAIIYPGYVKVLPTFIESIAHESSTTALFIIALVMGGMGYGAYYAYKKRKALMHTAFLAFLFAFLGFTTYTMVIIRANMDTPLNMNTPKTYTELLSYLNREQYGDFPTFKRRFATEPHQMVVYQNYDSDLEFWWRYQMNHMMTRYLLWNFAGRASWYQEDGANVAPFNSIAETIARPLGLKFGGTVATSLWALPLLLGIFGAYHHFRKDWKMATVFMLLFILMGYLTAYYQNQQQPQPRERDYFYVGAFFVFGVWIALGARGLVELATEKAKNEKTRTALAAAILALAFVVAPVRMLQANYYTHDRSENWAPWDYAYNLLQSCAPNAVLFTNGDNDTFPLWYLQDVEGIRRDVRIANLSLVNTHWYIKQLKNQAPYGAEPVKMRWTDAQIDQLRAVQWEPRKMSMPVPARAYQEFNELGLPDTFLV
ncbi:MAG: DUF2723 domain-containing protein, partial [Ignavibacteriales bacterium]|nr:DUF2723 domain-containing protein [Ignavibacteriales bacterium]